MPKLKDAIQQQISRMVEVEEQPVALPDTEVRNLLEAFASLISAYLKRMDNPDDTEPGRKWPRVSSTFGSLG